MAIKCCYGCVAPKRHEGCHGSCPEYLAEKAKHDAERAEEQKRRDLSRNLYEQRYDRVSRALKRKRKHKED